LATADALPERYLTGSLHELGLTVSLDAAGATLDAPAASDVWSALGGELKASLGVRVCAPLAGASRAAAPPVTEGLLVRSAHQQEDGDPAPGRRLRYEGVSDPGPEGFAAPRERRPAPARRRRGGRQP
ncbi:Pvc16 family protein, partial [Streptomyces broussonetiae]